MNRDRLMVAVGRRISRLRRERGITLSGLAEIAGISKSTLFAIESGESNPTISTLWAIADALNVPFGELLPEEPGEINESGITVRLIEQSDGIPKIEVYRMTLSSNSMRKANPHQKGVIEKVFVVSGSMLTGPVSSPKLLKAGEELEFRADVPHVYVAVSEGATAIITVKYPLPEDSQHGIARMFPENNAEWDELKTLLSRLSEDVLSGIPAFRIELRGSYGKDGLEKLKNVVYSLKTKNLKLHLIEDGDRVLIYMFNVFPGTFSRFGATSPDGKFQEAVKILKLSSKQRLLADEIEYLQNLTGSPSLLLSVLASEALLIHSRPAVPGTVLRLYEKELKNLKSFQNQKTSLKDVNVHLHGVLELLRPGYARQILFIAHVIEKYSGNGRIRALDATHSDYHLKMLAELVPGLDVLRVGNGHEATKVFKDDIKEPDFDTPEDLLKFDYGKSVPLIIYADTFHRVNIPLFLEKSYDLLENGGILIVSDEFVSPYRDRQERAKNAAIHHTKYMLETLIEIPENISLTDDERELVKLLSTNTPLISYLTETGEIRTAMSYAFQLHRGLSMLGLPSVMSHPLLSYYLLQYLELSAMVADFDFSVRNHSVTRKTYPERFKLLAEESGFSLLHHARVYATDGDGSMDAGKHVFVFKKEG